MAAETKRERVEATIRVFRAADRRMAGDCVAGQGMGW